MMPCPIVLGNNDVLSQSVKDRIFATEYFIVERARTTRRFLSDLGHPKSIQDLNIFEIEKNNPLEGLHTFLLHMKDGHNIGMFSEAGCPGIADPGHLAATYAHDKGYEVIPLVGPSSILLALISSGMNGQNFTFNGYLPNKAHELQKKLKSLEHLAVKNNQTQIFMEAPYRNEFILEHCMKVLSSNLRLCIACDINAPTQFIKTQSIHKWKGFNWKKMHKRPAIFLIGK